MGFFELHFVSGGVVLADVGLIGVGELADAEPETLWWIGEGSAGVRAPGGAGMDGFPGEWG